MGSSMSQTLTGGGDYLFQRTGTDNISSSQNYVIDNTNNFRFSDHWNSEPDWTISPQVVNPYVNQPLTFLDLKAPEPVDEFPKDADERLRKVLEDAEKIKFNG